MLQAERRAASRENRVGIPKASETVTLGLDFVGTAKRCSSGSVQAMVEIAMWGNPAPDRRSGGPFRGSDVAAAVLGQVGRDRMRRRNGHTEHNYEIIHRGLREIPYMSISMAVGGADRALRRCEARAAGP